MLTLQWRATLSMNFRTSALSSPGVMTPPCGTAPFHLLAIAYPCSPPQWARLDELRARHAQGMYVNDAIAGLPRISLPGEPTPWKRFESRKLFSPPFTYPPCHLGNKLVV